MIYWYGEVIEHGAPTSLSDQSQAVVLYLWMVNLIGNLELVFHSGKMRDLPHAEATHS